MRRHRLNAARANRYTDTGDSRRLPQKSGFARFRFDELDATGAEDHENETGKTGSAAEIDEAARRLRYEGIELRRIEDVPPPKIGDRVAADEIDARRPADQQAA